MKYMCLLYVSEDKLPALGTPEFDEALTAYRSFNADAEAKGAFLAGEPLESVSTATTLRVRDGARSISDGPYAETKEQLIGFYLLECRDLDEALDYAAKIPAVEQGAIEVRPLMELPAATAS